MSEPVPETMSAVHLTGHGGLEMLEFRDDVPVPAPGQGEVLIRVGAAGVNNTDINTRIGWYSKSVSAATSEAAADGLGDADGGDAAWTGKALSFPLIQGADCCGSIVGVGEGVDGGRIGERVVVRSMMRAYVGYRPFECWTLGSECDGAFAQFVKAPSREAHRVRCDWSDAELASIPCSYSTAENLLHRARAGAERILVTGASGGVGSAAVQLAKRRGATVCAVASPSKADAVKAIGADEVVSRVDDLAEAGTEKFDLAVDVVGGSGWGTLLGLLKRGGRCAVAGAIAGPIVELDLRTLYLSDLTLFGCTFQDDEVFENLVGYVERGEIRPVVAGTYPLNRIADAQTDFVGKGFVGKLVLVPPRAP